MEQYSPSRRRRKQTSHATMIIWLSRLAIGAFVGIVLLIIGFFFLVLWYGRDLPTPGKLVSADLSESTRIFDRKNVLLYSVHDLDKENRIYVNLTDIPKDL